MRLKIKLFVSSGQDKLNGGAGNDILKGGAGMDVCQFTGIYGQDTINDSDGQGLIMVDGNPQLMGGKKIAHNVYYNETTKYTYTLSGAVGDQTLVIRKDGDNNQIIVQHWSATKNLNITLDDNVTAPPAPTPTRTIVGDLKPKDTDSTKDGVQWGYDNLVNVLVSGAEPDRTDELYGSAGNDLMQGLGGHDFLYGREGDDVIEGGAGIDNLSGGFGDDIIYGDSRISIDDAILLGNTQMGTGLNGDTLSGTVGQDTLIGGAGNDLLFSGMGSKGDLIVAGAGDDVIVCGNHGAGTSPYNDGSVYYPSIHVVVIPLLYWETGEFLLLPRSDFIGNSPFVNSGADIVYAGNGMDFIDGGSGDDVLMGEGGDDHIWGGLGSDVILGGEGADYIWGDWYSEQRDNGIWDQYAYYYYTNVSIYFFNATVTNLIVPLLASNTNDFLDGGAGDDFIYGGAGSDIVFGGDGDDELHGDYSVETEAYKGDDILSGGAGIDKLYGEGGDDTLDGGLGDDMLYGDSKATEIGNDSLTGGDGNDSLYGGAGDDVLLGGEGNDRLEGDFFDAPNGNDHQSIREVCFQWTSLRRDASANDPYVLWI